MSTENKKIMPKSFGGDGREPGAESREFLAFCPPDIQPRTRIIALCGVNDVGDNASPQKDGWFLSDFYLFHHLLENTHDFHSSNQLWFTCVEPKTLVAKYKEYAHGDRDGDRRVVLDDTILPVVESSNNLRVTHPNELRERFLATLRSETQIASQENQSVLVLVFGHGEDTNFGVAIGGMGTPWNAPKLTRTAFNAAVHPGVDLNLMITSCFSGGWLVKPMIGSSLSSMGKLNITGMAAVGHQGGSRAWATSISCGRAAGSLYATAVLNALVKVSDASSGESGGLEAGDDALSSPAYVNLEETVYEAYKAVDPFYYYHGISFSAQDDKWDSEWKTRSGFPLVNYKTKWEQLRKLPSAAPSDESQKTGTSSILGFRGSIGRGYHNVVKVKAQTYMESFPGPRNVGSNVDHRLFEELLEGKNFTEDRLAYINDVLGYRLSAMEIATRYVSFLDLKFTDGLLFDTEDWFEKAALAHQRDGDSADGVTKLSKFKEVNGHIMDVQLFDKPPADQGCKYAKPREYLAIALVESSLSFQEIRDRIERLVKLKNGALQILTETTIADTIMKDKKVMRHRDHFYQSIGKIGSRLRSLSPSKKGRKSLA